MSAAKKQYQSLLTDHKKRKERNGRLLAKLENVEKKAAFLQAKTDRIKSLKSIYKNNANKSASPVREIFSPNGRILAERVPLNLRSKDPQDYSYNPLQYSNYRYERIYNEPNPIYTMKPITLDDAIEEISRRFVLVPKTQEDTLFPLPNDDLIRSNGQAHPTRYDPYQTYSASTHLYEKDKNILQNDSDKLVNQTPKHFNDNESVGSKVMGDNGVGSGAGTGNYLSSSDDNVQNSAGSDICNERDLEDKDDSTEKHTKGKVIVNQTHTPEFAIDETNNSVPSNVTKDGNVEIKIDSQNKVSIDATIDPLVAKINESMIKERLLGSEVKTKDTPITNLLEKNIKEKEISIDRDRDVEQEAIDSPGNINPLQSIEAPLEEKSKPTIPDEQLIENEPNALYASDENMSEAKSENHEVTDVVENKVNEDVYKEQEINNASENNDPQPYDGIQQNYPDENITTEQKDEYEGEYVQEQNPLDPNQEVYPDEYNTEQYVTGEVQPQQQGEYDPTQQVYDEYNTEQYVQEQLDPNQQNYSEEYLTQEQIGNTVQEQGEYDPNQQYYGPNNGDSNYANPNYTDPNYVDPNYADPNYIDPSYVEVESQNTVYPVTDQYYTEPNENVEGETNEAVTTENQNDAYPVPDQYYSENNYAEGELNTREFSQEGTTNAEDTEQTYNSTEVKESAEIPYEDSTYAVDENVTIQEQDSQDAVYPNIETSEDANIPEQAYYDETGQAQYNQSAENNNTYEHQDNSQYYDDTTKADAQLNEEQNAAAKPLRILESDTEPEVSNRDESSKQESDFDFSIAQ